LCRFIGLCLHTVHSASLIQTLRMEFEPTSNPPIGVAYLSLSPKSPKHQKLYVLASIIAQLCQTLPLIPTAVYSIYQTSCLQPSLLALLEILRLLLPEFSRNFIILEASSDGSGILGQFMRTMCESDRVENRLSSVNILVLACELDSNPQRNRRITFHDIKWTKGWSDQIEASELDGVSPNVVNDRRSLQKRRLPDLNVSFFFFLPFFKNYVIWNTRI